MKRNSRTYKREATKREREIAVFEAEKVKVLELKSSKLLDQPRDIDNEVTPFTQHTLCVSQHCKLGLARKRH